MKQFLLFLIAAILPLVSFAAPTSNTQHYAGEVIKLSKIITVSTKKLDEYYVKYEGPGKSKSQITLYKLKYYTTDLNGNLSVASASVVVPDSIPQENRPVLSYQHGTATKRDQVPSNPYYLEAQAAGVFFASQGYLVVAADYLGLGANKGFHPYLHAESEATASKDALKALYSLDLTASNQLFLTGYSQGGHATMALHRHLQLLDKNLPMVTASAPMSGPYDLSNTTLKSGLYVKSNSKYRSLYSAYLILSMSRTYKWPLKMNDIFNFQYADDIEELFSGEYDYDEIIPYLPQDPKKLLRKSYLAELSTQQDHLFIQALKENDVYQWKPNAPVQLCGGKGDQDVPFENAVIAFNFMKSEGAKISMINVGDDKNHETAFEPCLKATYVFFESVRSELDSLKSQQEPAK